MKGMRARSILHCHGRNSLAYLARERLEKTGLRISGTGDGQEKTDRSSSAWVWQEKTGLPFIIEAEDD